MLAISPTLIAATGRLSGQDPIYLIDIEQRQTGGRWRLALWDSDVVYDLGDDYGPQTFRAVAGQLEEYSEADGELATWSLAVSNVFRLAQAKFEAGELKRQRLRLYQVDPANLALAGHHFFLQFVIQEATASAEALVITLGPGRIGSYGHPVFRFNPDRCDHTYKGPRCKYIGGLTTCDKSYSGVDGCGGHLNQANFGGWTHMLRKNDVLLG